MLPKKSKNENFSEDDIDLNLYKDDEDYDFSPLKDDSLKLKISKSSKLEFYDTKITSFLKHKRSSDSSDSSIDDIKSNSNNKSIKETNIKELTTLQKSFIKSQKENFDKQFNLLKTDFNLFIEYEKEIFKDTNLDIMFIMDLTGSMSMWLNEAKKSVNSIIEEIADNNPGSKIRLSFIGYRDYTEPKQIRIYNNIEFNDNIKEFNKFLSGLDCYGGGDEPEDVVGALNKALEMKWESNAKYAVLVCDAPCHGKKYHNVLYDKFENGDPDGYILEDIMQKFYDKGITFYCIEINDSTKKMFEIMKRIYNDENKFHIEKLGNSVHQFSFFVAFSASVLLGNEKYSKVKFTDILTNYRNETIEKIMKKYINNNGNINVRNNDSMTLQLIDQIENLNLGGEDKKLFDFINRMNDLSINKDQKEQNMLLDNNSNINNISNNNNFITNISVDDVIKLDKKEINYILKALSYNKNPNSVNDWVNPTIEEKIFKTKLQISFDTLKKILIKMNMKYILLIKYWTKIKVAQYHFL